jgi:serine/threonine-protein kinase
MLAGVVLPERYEPIRRIARGGMATVWCAHDRTLDRHVAIKLLAEPYAHDELAGRRFKREARAAARLSGHPNVVTIYDVGEAAAQDISPGRPFLVMEYLAGGTVADALRAGAVNREIALRWLHQAAAALDYAHRRGVIHRDVKLANFLLDRDRTLHVADFGIAQLGTEDNLTVTGEVLGTAAYLAPERALGQPATEASDRYALAVAAYELLVGERPFTAEHFAAQARQHVEEAPQPASRRNPELPAALDAALARGMAKEPAERFHAASDLVDAIERALDGQAATAATARLTRQTAPATRQAAPAGIDPWAAQRATSGPALPQAAIPRRGRARIAALAALAAGLLAVAIIAAASGGRGKPRATAHAALTAHAGSGRHSAKGTSSTSASTGGTTTSNSGTTSTTTAPPSTANPTTLEAQGHQLMVAGQYSSAIPILRQAVASAAPNSLTYAYALYDLGRSLRLAGNPRAAVPILWRRLQIPNQIPVVRAELALALEQLGQQASLPPGPQPTHGGDHHRGGGGGGPGGGGPAGDQGD